MIGKRIKRLREDEGLRQYEMAKRLGVSQPFLSQIECGEKEPSLEFVNKVADVFRISLSELFAGVQDPTKARYSVVSSATAQSISLDYSLPVGLRALASDSVLAGSLNITDFEWGVLQGLPLEGVSKEGYVSLLIAVRAVTKS